jgi:hypothetical protein
MKKSGKPAGNARPAAKGQVRSLESCLAEVRRDFPNLPRSHRRAIAKLLLQASQLEVLRHGLGDEAFDALFRDFVKTLKKAKRGRVRRAKVLDTDSEKS